MTAALPKMVPLEPACRIQAILPNDGSDRRLLEGLFREKGVKRTDTLSVRAVAALSEAKTKRGRLPKPEFALLVTIIVSPDEAEELFDYIYITARVGRPGGGLVRMDQLIGATAYELPQDLPSGALHDASEGLESPT